VTRNAYISHDLLEGTEIMGVLTVRRKPYNRRKIYHNFKY
jgi:hypothetical protein